MLKIMIFFLATAKIEISQPSEGVRRSSWVFWKAGDALHTKIAFLPEKNIGEVLRKLEESSRRPKNQHKITNKISTFFEIFLKTSQTSPFFVSGRNAIFVRIASPAFQNTQELHSTPSGDEIRAF